MLSNIENNFIKISACIFVGVDFGMQLSSRLKTGEKSCEYLKGEKERTFEEGKKRKSIVIFSCSAPPTSPVSPIVLCHNGGCLIILKTADYQSGRFQGPTSKQTQQYRTEREFLWTVWAPAYYKGHGFRDPPPPALSLSLCFSVCTPQKHTGNAMLQRATVVMSGGGFEERDTFQENMAASWKKKTCTCWISSSIKRASLFFLLSGASLACVRNPQAGTLKQADDLL